MIALIITIIVMLILVSVTVTSAINGGLFKKSKEAARETENAKIFEQIQLAVVASKKFENEMPYEEVLNLLDAKRNSDDYDEQTYNLYKNFFELMQDNKPIHAYFRLIGLDSNIMQNIDEHLDKDEILEAYCTLDGSSTSELMQRLKENEGITTEEEAKKYITDMLTDGANVTKRELGYELKDWQTNDLNRGKLLKELEPIMEEYKEIKKEEFGTNIIYDEWYSKYKYTNDWAIVLRYGGVKVTILGTGEIIGPEEEISEAAQDPVVGDITDGGKRPGSQYSPYLIASIEDLVEFSNSVNEGNTYEGKYIELAIDLDFKDSNSYKNASSTQFGDLNGDGTVKGIQEELTDENGKGFTPIGVGNEGSQKSFNGTFNGNYHKIKNIYINNNENVYLALFAKAENATIKNLGLERGKIINSNSGDPNMSSKPNYVAGIVGKDEDNGYKKATIKNCFVDLDEIKGLNAKKTIVAGIAINAEEINGCYNKTNITANYEAFGISAYGTKIINSYNIGNITSTGVEDETSYSIGIAHRSYVYNCYNYGAIVNEDDKACGINGFCEWGVSGIQNSCNLGDITSKGASAYGISIDVCGGDFYNLYNTGTILSDSDSAYGTVGQYTEYGDGRMRGKIINVGKVLGRRESTANTVCGKLSDSYYLAGQVYVNGVQKADDSYAKTQEEINTLLRPILEVINTPIEGKNLGNAFVADTNNINNGLPILKWQVEH